MRAFGRVQPFVLIVMCTGILLAYLTGIYMSGSIHASSRWMGAMLACSSVVVVLQKTAYKDSLKIGLTRVLGTLVGALVAYVYLLFFHFTLAGMLIAVFVLEMMFMMLNIYNNSHIATITLLIIMLVSQQSPDVNPAVNCLLRFMESAVGVSVGVGLVWVTEKWNLMRERLSRRGAHDDGSMLDAATMPLRWGHLRVVSIASIGQLTGGALATLTGIALPMLQIIRHPSLSPMMQGVVAAASLTGILVGSVLFGGLSDRRGYLLFFRLSPLLVLAGAFTVMIAGDSPFSIAGLFITGLGIGGDYSLDSEYISEIMPLRSRRTAVGIAKGCSAAGNILAAGVSLWVLRNWQHAEIWNRLFLFIAALGAISLCARMRFAQSPGWLASHGRFEEAGQALRYFLGSDVSAGTLFDEQRAAGKPARTSWSALLRRENIVRIVFSGVPWSCEGVGVYGIGVFLPALVMSLGLSKGVSGTIAHVTSSVEITLYISLFILAGFVAGLFAARRCDGVRMQTWGFVMSAAGLCLLLAAERLSWPSWVSITGFIIFEFFINAGPHLLTYVFPSRIYPVSERGAGEGLAAAMGKAGAIAGVLFMPVILRSGGVTVLLATVAGIMLAGALVTAFAGRKVLPRKRPARQA